MEQYLIKVEFHDKVGHYYLRHFDKYGYPRLIYNMVLDGSEKVYKSKTSAIKALNKTKARLDEKAIVTLETITY